MQKTYEINDESNNNKRLYKDFNLYGCNLNRTIKDNVDDLIKYGRIK